MAIRFIDTSFFNKGLIRGLSGANKLLFVYLITNCNHAGIWDVFTDDAELKTGFKYDWNEVIDILHEKIVLLDGGEKWFIPSFIEFQYKSMTLNPGNNAHKSCLNLLKKYHLTKGNEVLTSPCLGAKEEEQEKEEDNEEEKDIRSLIIFDTEFCSHLIRSKGITEDSLIHMLEQFVLKRIEDGVEYDTAKQARAGFEKWVNSWIKREKIAGNGVTTYKGENREPGGGRKKSLGEQLMEEQFGKQ